MKAKEAKGLSNEDLNKKTKDLKEELFNLRIQNLSGSLEDTTKIRIARRSIARLKTLVRQTELAKEIKNKAKLN
jgi:large subunit ribosomal protein L29